MHESPTPAPPDRAERLAPAPPPSAARSFSTLRKRVEFRACARGQSAHMPGMVVQARCRRDGTDGVRVGFTASRRVGKAVIRNRARRRLREVARQVLRRRGLGGWDYVLIARNEATVTRPFTRLVSDLERSLDRLHGVP